MMEQAKILVAADGPQAVRAVQEQHFDLMILDIVMDGMDEFQVISQFRNLGI